MSFVSLDPINLKTKTNSLSFALQYFIKDISLAEQLISVRPKEDDTGMCVWWWKEGKKDIRGSSSLYRDYDDDEHVHM